MNDDASPSAPPPPMAAAPLSAQALGALKPATIGADADDISARPYLEGLNDAQRKAVLATEGPILLLAGAGTGKTRTLTSRLAHILASRLARPYEILAVTFTNKAAREMKERIGALIGDDVEDMRWLGTFHAIAARMLRMDAQIVGLRSSFTIIDTDDQIRLAKQVIEASNLDEKRWTARALIAHIEGWKNRGLIPAQVPAAEGQWFAAGQGINLYIAYQNRLTALNAADFGDLLLHCLTIFQNHPDILARYQNRFRYIMVDEYQDTNIAQYLWLRLLSQGQKNICCVGDDDQSIYGWRGAEVENILRFEKDFHGAQLVKLEQNYRSTPAILAAASGLISSNQSRLGKTLWTDNKSEEKVQLCSVWDGEAEAIAICDAIEVAQQRGRSLNEVAILVRASFQMRNFEEQFNLRGLAYQVVGGPRFYEREETRDALAYLRLVRNPDDDLSFSRVINKPRRGFGDKSLQALAITARTEGLSMLGAGQYLIERDSMKGKARTSLIQFVEALTRWRVEAKQRPLAELAPLILEESGYTDYWKNSKHVSAPTRLDNLKELVTAAAEFDTLEGYLDHVSLVSDVNTASTDGQIWLMTLHAAKGLEYPLVFLPGWEEGIFPSQRALDEEGAAGLEEERRLAYVGLTRAKQSARIFFAANRLVYGRWQNAIPSRFIDELPPEQIDILSGAVPDVPLRGGPYEDRDKIPSRFDRRPLSGNSNHQCPPQNHVETWRPARNEPVIIDAEAHDMDAPKTFRMISKGRKPRSPAPTSSTMRASSKRSEKTAPHLELGARVFHQKFGYGTVREVNGTKLQVEFETSGLKNIIERYLSPPP